MSRTEFVIAPPKRWLSINWQELWRYRDLYLVLAVRHKKYMVLDPDEVIKKTWCPIAVIDYFGILDIQSHCVILNWVAS